MLITKPPSLKQEFRENFGSCLVNITIWHPGCPPMCVRVILNGIQNQQYFAGSIICRTWLTVFVSQIRPGKQLFSFMKIWCNYAMAWLHHPSSAIIIFEFISRRSCWSSRLIPEKNTSSFSPFFRVSTTQKNVVFTIRTVVIPGQRFWTLGIIAQLSVIHSFLCVAGDSQVDKDSVASSVRVEHQLMFFRYTVTDNLINTVRDLSRESNFPQWSMEYY